MDCRGTIASGGDSSGTLDSKGELISGLARLCRALLSDFLIESIAKEK